MKPNIKRFSLFLEYNNNDGVINWEISPEPKLTLKNNNVIEYQYELDSRITNVIKISVTSRTGSNSHVRVTEMRYNDIVLENIDSYSVFKTANGVTKPYGYLDKIGDFYLKLRGDPITLNYMAYLSSLTKENKVV
jgi:hypothetical protein